MTISTTASRISYNGNGVTTVFSFPYRFLANGDVMVVELSALGVETTKTLTTDYTLTGAGDDAGGSVTMLVAPASGTKLTIYRDTDVTQEVDYISGDPFPAETHERALDRLTMIVQETNTTLSRTLKIPVTSSADTEITFTAGEFLAINQAGDAIITTPGAPDASVPVSTFMETLLDDTTAAAGRATLEAAGSGAVTASDLTMATARMLGRTTAGTGALEELTAAQVASLLAGYITPVGTIIDFAGDTAPTGFLACPTTATNVSRTTYAALFTAIGETWGAGDGSTTFGLPWFPADYTGVQANANVGTATTGDVKAHTHTVNLTSEMASGANSGSVRTGSTTNTGSTGGSANLAAGHRVLKCVKFQ